MYDSGENRTAVYTPNQACQHQGLAYIYWYHATPPIHARGVQPMLGQRRRRLANIDLILVSKFHN